jgi:acetyl esterase/lipase
MAAVTFHGVPEQFGSSIKDFIETEPCIIVAPDYRKAVESPYPAAFNDCYDTLLWIRDNAASIGGRTDRFIVSGHSAGGGLAAAVSLKATDTDDAKIAFQMPLYPMIDDRQNSASALETTHPYGMKKPTGWHGPVISMAWMNVTPYAAAARCTDYTKLPPTITYVGSMSHFGMKRKSTLRTFVGPMFRSSSRYSTALFTVLT